MRRCARVSVRRRDTARANVLWSQKALRLEDAVSSGTEMKLELVGKTFCRGSEATGQGLGFILKTAGQQQRVLKLRSDVVGVPQTGKADCEGRGSVSGEGFLETLRGIGGDCW